MEEWRNIKDYEGLYQVSNMGNVKTLKYKGFNIEKLLKPILQTNGYLYVQLYKDGNPRIYRVHRLVAEAFIPNPDNLSEVNHINENKTDNRVGNLEFCSHQYNCNYGTGIQRSVEKRSKTVYQYTMDGELVKEYPSVNEAARQNSYDRSNITNCCNGKRKTAHGYKWKYKEPQSN